MSGGCSECVEEFMEAGGCNAIMDESLNVDEFIPEGCSHCGGDAFEACMSSNSFFFQKLTPG